MNPTARYPGRAPARGGGSAGRVRDRRRRRARGRRRLASTCARARSSAIVGESGSGKSVTAQTLMGLTRSPNAAIAGSVRFHGMDLVTATDEELQTIRGREIAMVFQDPMTSLNPVYRVGAQIVEQIEAHKDMPDKEAKERAVELLDSVGIPNAKERVDDYPYEFSGGMRQRAMIAMALALEPRILIADEPTTALDVTIQAQILQLIREPQRGAGPGGDPDHPRPRRDRRGRRPRPGHVRRTDRRAGHPRRHLLRPPAPLHLGADGLAHAARPAAARPPAADRRPAALAARAAPGLPLPPALPARLREVHRAAGPGGAAARGERPRRSLLARPRTSASCARWRGGSGSRCRLSHGQGRPASGGQRTSSSTSRSRRGC